MRAFAGRRPNTACSPAVFSLVEEGHVDFTDIGNSGGLAAAGRATDVGIQLRLGLLAKRRARVGSADFAYPAADGTYLTRLKWSMTVIVSKAQVIAEYERTVRDVPDAKPQPLKTA